jgi:hypothetical protein
METSNHVPCVIFIPTSIPRRNIFHFENFWLDHHDFMNVVQQGWVAPVYIIDVAKVITAKSKNLRRVLKDWQKNLSSLKLAIANVKLTISFLLFIEEFKDLTILEWNFKSLLEEKLTSLLHQQHINWRQRGSIKWTKLGDASTKFFHANATIKYRRNLITTLKDSSSQLITDHNDKVDLIWHSFKERLGVSSFTGITFNLSDLIQSNHDLSSFVTHFSKEEIDLVVKSLPSDKAPSPDGFNTDFIKGASTLSTMISTIFVILSTWKMFVSLLHKIFCAVFPKWPRRRAAWLPASVIQGWQLDQQPPWFIH